LPEITCPDVEICEMPFPNMLLYKKLVLVAVIVIATSSGVLALHYYESPKQLLQKTTGSFNNTSYSIIEFKLPDKSGAPLFPIYDKNHNAIWVGDTKDNSSRIWEFDIDLKKFSEHRISGTNLISKLSLDHNGTIWFIDPVTKLLGSYDPNNNDIRLVKIPTDGIVGDLITDKKSVWILVPNIDKIFRYDIQSKNFTSFSVPTAHGSPIAITTDSSHGYIWIVEVIGKILRLDPTSFKMIEYSPQDNLTLKLPVAIKSDSITGNIYVSEHGEDAVFSFFPNNETFKRFSLQPDPNALPFGMAFDSKGELFVAEHTTNKIAVLDSRTGESIELDIPSTDPLTQWLTSDAEGNIWFAEPGGAALGVISERQ
jgi:copper transport protein